MGMSEITWVSCDGHKRVVEYNELDQPIGESATKLKSFIGTTVRVHVPISYQSSKDVPTEELKDKIYELIEVIFSPLVSNVVRILSLTFII